MNYHIKSFGEIRVYSNHIITISSEFIGLFGKKLVQVVWSGFYENQIDIQMVFCFR